MRHIFSIIILFISISVFGQYVRYDSTVIHQNRLIYNNAGYYIGKDSLHTKRVRLVYCNDTVPVDYDTLIQRFPQRFITMDSVVDGGYISEDFANTNYVRKNTLDTIISDKVIDNAFFTKYGTGADYVQIDNLGFTTTNGDKTTTIQSSGTITISKDVSNTVNIGDNNIQIYRGSYDPSADEEVINKGETKTLISDSLATRPSLATVRSEISDSLATIPAPDLTDYVRKDITDTLSNIIRFGSNGWDVAIDSTGISLKNDIEFTGYNYFLNIEEGFNLLNGTGKIFNATPGGLNITGTSGNVTSNGSNVIIASGSGASVSTNTNSIQIERNGYSATGSTEVPIVSEVKTLISDSLTTRLASYTNNTDLEEKIQDQIGTKIIEGSGITRSYNDATGETTLSVTGGSGLTSEQIFDTLAYSIRVGEGLNKTKSDTGDSLYIELKFKNALERVVYGAGCHKSVFMATNTTGGTAHWGFQTTATGTVTAPTKSTTNRFQFANRWETLVTSASTTAVAGFRTNATTHGFGNASGMGGFYYNSVTGAATGLSNSNARYFSGFSNSVSAPTDVDPSTLTNIFGIGYDDTDANLQFMHNDASGTATKVDLGSNFAVTTSDRTNFYRLIMYAEPNTTTVYYKVIDMTDGDTYTGSVNTNLPSSTTFFGPYGYTSVGGSSAVTGFSIMSIEVFTDF